MKDFRLEMKLKNNRIFKMMEERGIASVAELSRLSGINQVQLGLYMNLKESPFRGSFDPYASRRMKKILKDVGLQWRVSAIKLADFFMCSPEDLFPESVVNRREQNNKAFIEINARDVAELTHGMSAMLANSNPEQKLLADEVRDKVAIVLKSLTPREELLIKLRYTDDLSYSEIAERLGVGEEQVRHIETKALKKLRHPRSADRLKEFL